jgi:DNA-binding Lrp family transcriptional regulator
MSAAIESEWKKLGNTDRFYAAFVFMDEATRSRFNAEQMRPANTPSLANKMSKAGDANLVFAHALVGPSDLLVGVKAKNFKELVETVQTRIRKNVNGDNFVHKVQSHIMVSIEGRIDFAKEAFDGRNRSIPAVRAWVLATAGNLPSGPSIAPGGSSPGDADVIGQVLGKDVRVKFVAKVIGGYDYFIYVEAEDMKMMQSVVDGLIRNRREFIATDTRIVMHEE